MSDWREGHAGELDRQADVIMAAEDALEEALAVLTLHRRDKSCTELRAAASLLRLEKRALTEEARELRRHDDVTVLPMSLTTRSVRP
jgi:hypothetical protein